MVKVRIRLRNEYRIVAEVRFSRLYEKNKMTANKYKKAIGFEASFHGMIWKSGTSLVITVPDYIVKGLVLQVKEPVEIIIKKIGEVKK